MKVNNFLTRTARTTILRTSIMACIAGSTMLTSCKKETAAQTAATDLSGTKKVSSSSNLLGSGGDGGYFYQSYSSGGTATMSSGTNGGNFAVTWSNISDGVWGKGWCTRSQFYLDNGTATPVNTATSVPETRKVGYNLGSITGDTDFFGIYGWTQGTNPGDEPIEYYVVESGPGFGGTGTGQVLSDGQYYSVKKARRPPGSGTPFGSSSTGFDQYLDRWGGASTGVNRQVDMGVHIANWKTTFGKWGTMYMMILAAEGNGYGQTYGSSGSINATVWSNN